MTKTRNDPKYKPEGEKSKYLLDKENMSPEKTAVFNIRKNEKGLYFDLKLYGNENKIIKNLLIPKQFYSQNNIGEDVVQIKMDKVLLFKHILIYCAAVLSIIVIIDGIMRFIPWAKRYFGL